MLATSWKERRRKEVIFFLVTRLGRGGREGEEGVIFFLVVFRNRGGEGEGGEIRF